MTQTSLNPSLRQRLFTRFMAGSDKDSFEMYKERKRQLLSPLRGTVVELGPGTGVNLQFYDPATQWIGLEPNPAMHSHIIEKAEKLGLNVDVRAESLADSEIAEGTVDAIVSTLVLCSVPSVAQVLREVHYALKPGGTFAFLEHVVDRPRTLRRFIQKFVNFTPWRYFSDGCNPGRDIGRIIGQAGFSTVECDLYMQEGPGIILAVNRPHICGIAVK